MAAEQVLMQLPVLLLQDPPGVFETTNFFADQLDSFELWLLHGSSDKPPPRQLPIVLQVGLLAWLPMIASHKLSTLFGCHPFFLHAQQFSPRSSKEHTIF